MPSEKAEYAVGIMTISDTITGAKREPSQIATIRVTATVGNALKKLTAGASSLRTGEYRAPSSEKAIASTILITKAISVLSSVPKSEA